MAISTAIMSDVPMRHGTRLIRRQALSKRPPPLFLLQRSTYMLTAFKLRYDSGLALEFAICVNSHRNSMQRTARHKRHSYYFLPRG